MLRCAVHTLRFEKEKSKRKIFPFQSMPNLHFAKVQLTRAKDTLMEDNDNKHILFWIALVLFFSAGVQSQGTSSSSAWRQKNAELRFRIEKDYTHSLIPSVSLLDVVPDKKSESVGKWI